MSDLISRKELMERILQEEYDNDIHTDGRAKAIHHGEYQHFYKVIVETPTAFDLESMIEQIEEKRDYCYSEMKKQENRDIQEVEPLYFEQMHNQGMAYNNALEILKSAANATNRKNGG